jgi:quercetin dioxygenase-like cupin family protein
MDHLRKGLARTGSLAAAVLAASALIAAPAQATPASGFTAVQQHKGDYGPLDVKGEKSGHWDVKLTTKGDSDVYITRNSIAVGGHSGWHMHPGPSLITVTIGSITAYDSDDPLCSPKVYNAGQGFVDSGHHAHILRNESGAAAETIAVQFLADGSTRRIDAEAPQNSPCNF